MSMEWERPYVYDDATAQVAPVRNTSLLPSSSRTVPFKAPPSPSTGASITSPGSSSKSPVDRAKGQPLQGVITRLLVFKKELFEGVRYVRVNLVNAYRQQVSSEAVRLVLNSPDGVRLDVPFGLSLFSLSQSGKI